MHKFPRQKLCELIGIYGESLCDQPLRCKGLLRDFCGQHLREVNLLINALNERVASELRYSSGSTPMNLTLARLATRLEDQQGLTKETARWAVESWALALGKISERDLQREAATISTPRKRQKQISQHRTASAGSSKNRKRASTAIPGAGPPPPASTAFAGAPPVPAKSPSPPILPAPSPRTAIKGLLTLIAIAVGTGALYYVTSVGPNRRHGISDNKTPSPPPIQLLTPTLSPSTTGPKSSSPFSAPAEPTSSPDSVTTPVVTTSSSPFELSSPPPTINEEDVRSLIESAYSAFNRGDVNALLSYYDDRVDYLEYGQRDKQFVREDFNRHFARWPSNSYSPRNIVVSTSTTENVARASFDITFSARNDSAGRASTGRAHEEWSIRKSDGTLKIFSNREVVFRDPSPAGTIPASITSETENAQAFIVDYLAALSRRDLDAVVAKFDTTVDYQGKGKRNQSYIREDTGGYLRKWDRLQFQLETVRVDQTSDGHLLVFFDFIYSLANNRETKRGRSRNVWTLRRVNGDLRITAQRETIVAKF